MRLTMMTGAAALALLAACGGEDEAEAELRAAQEEMATEEAGEDLPPATQDAAEAREAVDAEAFLAENAGRAEVRTLDSGLQIETLTAGEGEAPTAEDVLRLSFEARFADGRPFDSSENYGGVVTLGSYEDLPLRGLVEALPQMREGETARLTLPPRLAFGEEGVPGGVGPDEVIVFDMTLVEVIDPEDEARLAALEEEAARAREAQMAQMEAQRAEMMAEFEAMASSNQEASEAFLAEVGSRDGIERTDSGLLYEVVDGSGEGPSPQATDQVRVHYRGTLPDGSEFDSSYSRSTAARAPSVKA